MKDNNEHNKLVKEISKKYNLDKRVVNFIINHSFIFTHNVIKDDKDWRPIMLRYIGKFVPMKNRIESDKSL